LLKTLAPQTAPRPSADVPVLIECRVIVATVVVPVATGLPGADPAENSNTPLASKGVEILVKTEPALMLTKL
jgi:hypothetical protein